MSNDLTAYPRINSSQIKYSGEPLSTEGCDLEEICTGDNLDDIIREFYDFMCIMSTECKVQINADDTCGFLEDKFISSDDSVSIETSTDEDENIVLDITSTSSSIITNDQTQYDRTSVGDFATFTIDAGNISSNGDQVIIDTWFQSDQVVSDSPACQIKINGTGLMDHTFGTTARAIKVRVELNRITATTCRYHITYSIYTAPTFTIYPTINSQEVISGITVLDFSTAITVVPNFKTDSATNITMSNIGTTIKHFRA